MRSMKSGFRVRPYYDPFYDKYVETEDDVARLFHKYIDGPVRGAFYHDPYLRYHGALPPSKDGQSPGVKVDVVVCLQSDLMAVVAVGEMKRPGVIRKREWRWQEGLGVRGGPSVATRHFARELAVYAFTYRTAQVFCFDSHHLLISRWPINRYEDIREELPYVWVLGLTDCGQMSVTPRHALYSLIIDRLRRVIASRANDGTTPLSGEWILRRLFYSGQVYWQHQDSCYPLHPGWEKKIDERNRRWVWISRADNRIMYWEPYAIVS